MKRMKKCLAVGTLILFLASCAAHQPSQAVAPLEFPEAKVVRYEETYRPLSEEELKAMHEPRPPVAHSSPYGPRNSPSGYIPLVDPATITDHARFDRDLAECATLAASYGPEDRVASGAAGSAMVGAGAGALLSYILGASPGRGAATGAVTWGTTGAVASAAGSQQDYQIVYANCMRGRGWTVLR